MPDDAPLTLHSTRSVCAIAGSTACTTALVLWAMAYPAWSVRCHSAEAWDCSPCSWHRNPQIRWSRSLESRSGGLPAERVAGGDTA